MSESRRVPGRPKGDGRPVASVKLFHDDADALHQLAVLSGAKNVASYFEEKFAAGVRKELAAKLEAKAKELRGK